MQEGRGYGLLSVFFEFISGQKNCISRFVTVRFVARLDERQPGFGKYVE